MQKIIINLVIMFFSIGINAEQKYIGFNDPESVAEGPDGAILFLRLESVELKMEKFLRSIKTEVYL